MFDILKKHLNWNLCIRRKIFIIKTYQTHCPTLKDGAKVQYWKIDFIHISSTVQVFMIRFLHKKWWAVGNSYRSLVEVLCIFGDELQYT